MKLDPSIFEGYASAWFFLGIFTGLLIVGIIGRGPIRLFARFGRVLTFPFRPITYLLRRLRLLPRASARARSARNAFASAGAAVPNTLQSKSEIELALSAPDVLEDTENEDALLEKYSFADEKAHTKFSGRYFRSIAVRPGFFPVRLTTALTEEIGDDYLGEAQTFFNRQVPLKSNYNALFEDVEGSITISMFLRYDRRCYWILNEMRKTINGNARRLMILFSIVLMSDFAAFMSTSLADSIKIGISLFAVGFMLLSHNVGYHQQQKHTIRELRSFLTRYLGRISDRYREVTGNARGVTVGDETDSAKLSESAKKWHKIMIWLPFRTFFIETFVRNVLYQIDRNSSYYLYISLPVAVGISLYFIYALVSGLYTVPVVPPFLSVISLLSVILVFFTYLWLTNKVVIGDELNQLDWLGYDNLNVSAAMDEVVGKYAEDVGFWKGRLDR